MADRKKYAVHEGNREIPGISLSVMGLDPCEGPLDRPSAKHLLERCLFGARLNEINRFEGLTIDEALDILLTDMSAPSPPLNTVEGDEDVASGETWINAPYSRSFNGARKKSLRSWWVGLIINQDTTLREKMVLFWHNHFVTEVPPVGRSKYLYSYIELLREQAMGNFRTLTEKMTVNTAMLKYLDGDENKARSPNENYARELFELFSIGKGPLLGDGDYTYYTENDIQEAARVLTGWDINNTTQESYFVPSRHDNGTKTFSEYYGGKQITNAGAEEYKSLISMIFEKKETARRLARKLYRWFVYYIIDETIEANIIEPLATTIYESSYEMKPALRQLLSSQHFFDETYRGCYIKNPYEHLAGCLRKLEMVFSPDYLVNYELWNTFYFQGRNQEMVLGEPPDVAGWPQWYLSPQYNQLWINSVTLPQKVYFTDKILGRGWTKLGFILQSDAIGLAEMLPDPSEPNVLIGEFADLFLPVVLNREQIDYLKGILIPGLPDFEWTVEWNRYKNNPGDQNQKEAVEDVLRSLLKAMLRMPEYCLM